MRCKTPDVRRNDFGSRQFIRHDTPVFHPRRPPPPRYSQPEWKPCQPDAHPLNREPACGCRHGVGGHRMRVDLRAEAGKGQVWPAPPPGSAADLQHTTSLTQPFRVGPTHACKAEILRRQKRPDGAVKRTRTSTGCPTATSTLRVYQFRHDRTLVCNRQTGRIRRAQTFVKPRLSPICEQSCRIFLPSNGPCLKRLSLMRPP